MDGHVHARIDAHAGVLHARRADARVTTFAKALALSQQYVSETKVRLHHRHTARCGHSLL